MCYLLQTLSLTTVDSWKTGVICEVVTPQRQDHVWSSPLAILLLQLRTAGLLSLKIEWANSISAQNWGYTEGRHTQRQCQNWQSPLAKLVIEKKQKQQKKPKQQQQQEQQKNKQTNWGYMWGCHSSKTRPSLVKPPCHVSPNTRDCRVVRTENWVSKLNIHTELGLCVGSSHPKTMSELTKPPLH